MKRWNGWGYEHVEYPIKDNLVNILKSVVGEPEYSYTASKDDILNKMPPSKIKENSLIKTNDLDRLYHARGQSLPDWISLRFGKVDTFPDGVAYPKDENGLNELIKFAAKENYCLIPYGGGTSVLGHINPANIDVPIITVSMGNMDRLIEINDQNRCAMFYAGISGPKIEKQLKAMGYTLGHFPQSFEFSTLGGWIATKSSGQQSLGYGRIDNMFLGGTVHTPKGVLEIPHIPGSAAGPDIKSLILGSEGRVGILSKALVKIHPIPEKEIFEGYFLPNWEQGYAATKTLVQEKFPLSLLRLSNEKETYVHMNMAGGDLLIEILKRYLALRGAGDSPSLLLVGYSGKAKNVKRVKKDVSHLLRKEYSAVPVYEFIGNAWKKNRFKAPYLRNSLWELGYAVDTLETSVPWDKVTSTMEDIESSIESALVDEDEKVYSFSHLSHFYQTGPSIYTTYIYRIAKEYEVTLNRWKKIKMAASKAIVRNKGTISHHHGVGIDHKDYLVYEKGEIGISALKDLISSFDPKGIMNPGKLI